MPEEISPEEKLLRLIRKKERPSHQNDTAANPAEAPRSQASSKTEKKKENKQLLLVLEKLLFLACVVLLVYAAYEFLFVRMDIGRILKEKIPKPEDLIIEEVPISQNRQPYIYYAEQIKKRDIFESPLYKKENENPVPQTTVSDITRSLRLVGIVLDKNDEAIIEDLESRQTFFVHKGDHIKDAVVEEIQESKIILLYNNQRVELAQ